MDSDDEPGECSDGNEDSDEDSDSIDLDEDEEDDNAFDILTSKKTERVVPLTKDQLLLCTTILKGYSLKDKKWRKSSFAQVSSGDFINTNIHPSV